ncbi:MAG: LysM domain-containing protein [Ilumatobacteraceae bacterium]|nr:LysM domain-containing protein [Ilumatobacteraceae bacterium]
MNHDDDLERTVARSLRQRTERVTTAAPDLDGVWAHVDRRQSRRRRATAAIGSVAAVGVGVVGITMLGGTRADDTGIAAAPGGVPTTTMPAIAVPADGPAGGWAWACTTPVTVPNGVPGVQYFLDCLQVGTGDQLIFPTTTIVNQLYVVQAGDTLSSISAAFGVGIDELVWFNGWEDGASHVLLPGETVSIPGPDVVDVTVPYSPTPTTVPVQGYVVQPGDTIEALRERWALPPGLLTNLNGFDIEDSYVLTAGELIYVPGYLAPGEPGLIPQTTTTSTTTTPEMTTTTPPTTTIAP